MTKIEEIKYAVLEVTGATDYEDCIDQCMKEYAEVYARKVLEVAMNNATILYNGQSTRDRIYYIEAYDSSRKEQTFQVDPDSILNIKLPEHE